MIESRISSKSQTTVPKPVRVALGLQEGDRLAYTIEGDRVVLTRARASGDMFVNPYTTFTEGATISTRLSTIFERGNIVRVPFPHVERPIVVPRPALVISTGPIGPDSSLIWTLMITNLTREPWPGDIPIEDADGWA